MKRFHRPFFALLLSLLLIGMQQAAFAHLLSHAPGGTKAAAQYQGDHGSVDGAAESCTTCIAFATVGGSAPPASSKAWFVPLAGDQHKSFAAPPLVARPLLTRRARAPPQFL